jgi:hypothetical protein
MEVTVYSIGQRLFIAVMVFALSFSFPFPTLASGLLVTKTLDRDADAVIVTGACMPGFTDAPLNQLFVYAYRESQWQQIPWQFDEVKNGAYIASDNKQLDTADELVVMGRDCGDRAMSDNWISDASARSHQRCEITVVDPLDTVKLGWIYVYRSTSLRDTVTQDYVAFDYATSVFTTPVYKLGFFINYLGGHRMELNGSGVDVLDRSKFRFKAPDQDVFNEEWAEGEDPQPEILDGRVRAIAGYQEQGQGILTFAYRSHFYDLVTVDLSWAPKSFEWVRASADFNENIKGGTYYDANTSAGVPVDGKPDVVATTPASLWQQISASTGTVVHTADVTPMRGTLSTYYNDNSTIDPTDTGDKKSYGEMGLTVTNPIKYIYLAVTHYILPPNQPNVGATYYAYFAHPLQCQANQTAVKKLEREETPRSFFLSSNYPNPFNPITTMQYQVSEPTQVEIAIYELLGRKIRTLVNEIKTPGTYEIQWNGLNQIEEPVTSGIYFCVLKTVQFNMTRQLVLLR